MLLRASCRGRRSRPGSGSASWVRNKTSGHGKKLQGVRGTQDFFPETTYRRTCVIDRMKCRARSYGFHEVQTPIMEPTELFTRSLGDGSDVVMKEMYTFKDLSENSLSLRPEGTAGVARALQNGGKLNMLPQKLYYAGEMFRYERPQRGVELVGPTSAVADVEAIALGADMLNDLGILDKTELQLNTLGDEESRRRYRKILEEYFRSHEATLSEDSKARLNRGAILRILDSKDKNDKEVVHRAPSFSEYLTVAATERFQQIQGLLDGLQIDYRLNPRLVRGLDYYCHTAFEFIEKKPAGKVRQGNTRTKDEDGSEMASGVAVLAGGRYDGLFSALGGPDVAAVGWAAGIERLVLLTNEESIPPQDPLVAVIPVLAGDSVDTAECLIAAAKLGKDLRLNKLNVHVGYESSRLKKEMKTAHRLGAVATILVGENELKEGKVSIKNMDSGEQQTVFLQEVSAALKGILGASSS